MHQTVIVMANVQMKQRIFDLKNNNKADIDGTHYKKKRPANNKDILTSRVTTSHIVFITIFFAK